MRKVIDKMLGRSHTGENVKTSNIIFYGCSNTALLFKFWSAAEHSQHLIQHQRIKILVSVHIYIYIHTHTHTHTYVYMVILLRTATITWVINWCFCL